MPSLRYKRIFSVEELPHYELAAQIQPGIGSIRIEQFHRCHFHHLKVRHYERVIVVLRGPAQPHVQR